MNPFIANIISVHIGILVSFILNCKFNFKKTDRVLFRAISFYFTGVFGLILSQGIIYLGVVLSISASVAKLGSIVVVAAVQFSINKLITFRK
ncbi:putative flippase GtrA [Lachnospiraceae bacterium PF1-22]